MSQKIKDQPSQRRNRTYFDQHGRKWFAVIEVRTGDPCGAFMPRGFKDRLGVPERYKIVNQDDPTQLRINYDAMIEERRRGHHEWEQQLRQQALKMYGQEASAAIAKPPPELLEIIGEKPQPVELIQAARSGNKYVLGLSSRMPAWAKPFYPEPVQEPEPVFPDAEDEALYPDADEETVATAPKPRKPAARKRTRKRSTSSRSRSRTRKKPEPAPVSEEVDPSWETAA